METSFPVGTLPVGTARIPGVGPLSDVVDGPLRQTTAISLRKIGSRRLGGRMVRSRPLNVLELNLALDPTP